MDTAKAESVELDPQEQIAEVP